MFIDKLGYQVIQNRLFTFVTLSKNIGKKNDPNPL